jgi:phosphohistidine phosphatase
MRIILFRHAPAEARDAQRWPDDLVRPLTSRGESRGRRAARGLLRLESGVTRVLTSPALRALATAEVLARELDGAARPEALASLAPGGSWRETLKALAQEPADATVVLVGHEPDLGKLAGVLLFGAPTAMPLKKAGACAIDVDAAEAGAGRLRWLLPPNPLRRLARKKSKA